MNKKQHQKELADTRRQIAALRIALDTAINKEQELEGVYPPANSKFQAFSEEQLVQIHIDSMRRRKIPLDIFKK